MKSKRRNSEMGEKEARYEGRRKKKTGKLHTLLIKGEEESSARHLNNCGQGGKELKV